MRTPSQQRYSRATRQLLHGVVVAFAVGVVLMAGSAKAEDVDILKTGTCTVGGGGTCTFLGGVTTTRSFGVLWTPTTSVNVCGISIKVARGSTNPLSQTDDNEKLKFDVYRHASYGDLDGQWPIIPAQKMKHFEVAGADIPYQNQYAMNVIPWTEIAESSTSTNCFPVQQGDTVSFVVDQVSSGSYLLYAKNYYPSSAPSYLVPFYTDDDETWTVIDAGNAFEQYLWAYSPADRVYDSAYFDFPASTTYDFENIPPASSSWVGEILYMAGEYLKDIVEYLFVPADTELAYWTELKDLAQTRAPFSYVVQVQDIFENAASSSAAFPTLSFDMNPFGLHASVSLISPAGLNTYFTGTVKTLFQYIVIFSLWLLFGFHIYHTVLNLI
jgi:hypothetical protein